MNPTFSYCYLKENKIPCCVSRSSRWFVEVCRTSSNFRYDSVSCFWIERAWGDAMTMTKHTIRLKLNRTSIPDVTNGVMNKEYTTAARGYHKQRGLDDITTTCSCIQAVASHHNHLFSNKSRCWNINLPCQYVSEKVVSFLFSWIRGTV